MTQIISLPAMRRQALFLMLPLLLGACQLLLEELDTAEFGGLCGGTHGHPDCPDGYSCYGGQCLHHAPECYDDYLGPISGSADFDLEPNNTPEQAFTVICGDEFNHVSCLMRYGLQQQIVNLVICGQALTDAETGEVFGGGDIDFYRIFLHLGETISVTLAVNYEMGKDLDLRLIGYEQIHYAELMASQSTDQDEEITYSAEYTGWHYIEVRGKTLFDNQFYALQWTLTAPE